MSDQDLPRRKFLKIAALGAGMALTGCGNLMGSNTTGPVTAGAVGSFGVGSVTKVSGAEAFLIRTSQGFAARSSICTHQGCSCAWSGSRFSCPCHGSLFAEDGSVIRGPAARALPSYQVTVTNGEVVINTSVHVSADAITPAT